MLLRILLKLLMVVSVFAVAFAAVCIVVLAFVMAPFLTSGDSLTTFGTVMQGLTLTTIMAVAGAIAGLIYAVLPLRARDTWIAGALGAGVVLTIGATIRVDGASVLWTLVPAMMGAVAAAVARLLIRLFWKHA